MRATLSVRLGRLCRPTDYAECNERQVYGMSSKWGYQPKGGIRTTFRLVIRPTAALRKLTFPRMLERSKFGQTRQPTSSTLVIPERQLSPKSNESFVPKAVRDTPETSFDFLGYTSRPRRSKNRWGKAFINFSPTLEAKTRRPASVSGRLHRMASPLLLQ